MFWARLDKMVLCYVKIDIDPAANNQVTELEFTLPIPTTFTATGQLQGTAAGLAGTESFTAFMQASPTTLDRAFLGFDARNIAGTHQFLCNFAYYIGNAPA